MAETLLLCSISGEMKRVASKHHARILLNPPFNRVYTHEFIWYICRPHLLNCKKNPLSMRLATGLNTELLWLPQEYKGGVGPRSCNTSLDANSATENRCGVGASNSTILSGRDTGGRGGQVPIPHF